MEPMVPVPVLPIFEPLQFEIVHDDPISEEIRREIIARLDPTLYHLHLQNNLAVYGRHLDLQEDGFMDSIKDGFKTATDMYWDSPFAAPTKAVADGVGHLKKGAEAANDFVKEKTGVDMG